MLAPTAAVLSILLWVQPVATVSAAEDFDLVEAGRRIYDEGVLPGGKLLVATRPEGLMLEGRYAACTTCHRKSGMGSVEGVGSGQILVPPLAGPVLFAPARYVDSYLDEVHHWVPNGSWRRAMKRPAYDEASLAAALRTGLNSAGELMDAPMPRYDLDGSAVAALTAYLRQLGSEPDPGVDADALHIATVVTPQTDPVVADHALGVIRKWFALASGAGVPYRFHEWRLAGTPDTWGDQLDAYSAEQPVFALVSGIGGADWEAVHAYCERAQLACVLPSIDVAPAGAGEGHFSIYYSRGVLLEAGILARYLAAELPPTGRIVQLYNDDAGRKAADALAESLASNAQEIVTRRYHATVPMLAVNDLAPKDVLVAWLRTPELSQLSGVLPETPTAQRVILSAMLASPEEVELNAEWRSKTTFVTLFDDLGVQSEIARLRLDAWLDRYQLGAPSNRRIVADAYAAIYLLNAAFRKIRKEEVRRPRVPLTNEHLIETLEDLVAKYSDGRPEIDEDSHVAYYGRMSLGPGQRVAVRGGAIVRYASRESNRLELVSERIVP